MELDSVQSLTARLSQPQTEWRIVKTLSCFMIVGMLAAGCAHPGANSGSIQSSQNREIAMNQRWQNLPMSQLIAALGMPWLLLNIPGGGNPQGFVAVYARDPATGCLDTFALVYGADPAIRSYYCR